jgi:hypothetical protein
VGLYVTLDLQAEVFVVLEIDGDPDGDFFFPDIYCNKYCIPLYTIPPAPA